MNIPVRLTLILASVCCVSTGMAQVGTHQRLFGDGTARSLLLLEGGGFLTEHWTPSGSFTQQFDANGSPVRGMPGVALLGAGANGAMVFLTDYGSDGSFDEGFTCFVDIGVYTDQLLPNWSKRVTWDFGLEEPDIDGARTALVDAGGDVFITVYFERGTYVVYVPANGGSGWSYLMPGVVNVKLASDGGGGCYAFGEQSGSPLEGRLEAIHVLENGTVDFHKRYWMNDWFVATPQNVQVIGNELVLVVDHSMRGGLLVLDLSGDVMSYDKYAPTPPPPPNVSFGITGGLRMADGTYLLAGGYSGLQGKSTVLELTATREVQQARSLNTVSTNNVRTVFGFQAASTGDDVLGIAGFYARWDEVFNASILEWPIVWRLSGSLDELCLDETIQFAHVPVPSGSVTVQPMTTLEENTMTVDAISNTSIATTNAWSTANFCDQVVSTNELAAANGDELFVLRGNLLHSSDELIIEPLEALQIVVYTGTGQRIHGSRLSAGRQQALPGLYMVPGVYYVVGENGAGVRRTRTFVVSD